MRRRAESALSCEAEMRLLLVEDDPTISRFLLKGLREDQHVVDLAEDGTGRPRPGRPARTTTPSCST